MHRFYLKKPWTGLLYLLTFGLFGMGQLVDLFNLRDMVELERHRSNALPPLVPLRRRLMAPRWKVDPAKKLRQDLRGAARANGGFISGDQASVMTGKTEDEVEKQLDSLVVDGLADIDNHPTTGEVVYTFTVSAS